MFLYVSSVFVSWCEHKLKPHLRLVGLKKCLTLTPKTLEINRWTIFYWSHYPTMCLPATHFSVLSSLYQWQNAKDEIFDDTKLCTICLLQKATSQWKWKRLFSPTLTTTQQYILNLAFLVCFIKIINIYQYFRFFF